MDMSIWTSNFTCKNGEPRFNNKSAYFNYMLGINNKIPNFFKFFSVPMYDTYTAYTEDEPFYITPRYGRNLENLFNYIFEMSSTRGESYRTQRMLYTSALYGYYYKDGYWGNPPDKTGSSGRYFNIDHFRVNEIDIYGIRCHGDTDYSTGTPFIVVYIPAKLIGYSTVTQYIVISYMPYGMDIYNYNYSYQGQSIPIGRWPIASISTTNSDNVIGIVPNSGDNSRIKDDWCNPNYGKCDEYIFTPLMANGCTNDNVYIIDGGREFLPHLTKMTINNQNYFILNKHIAIKM